MFALSAENIASLEAVRSTLAPLKRRDDPAKLARRARRDALFAASMRDGLRRSRSVKLFCT